jgi:hypothetical protein
MTPSSSNSVRGRLERVRRLLLHPDADLAGVLEELEAAAEELRALDLPPAEMEAVRAELARVKALAKNGEEFWRGWGRLVGLEPGYTPGAQAATERPTPQLAIQG